MWKQTAYFSFASFTYPPTVLNVNIHELIKETDKGSEGSPAETTTVIKTVNIPGLEPDAYETVQEFYPSKDGTMIPMFIARKKGRSSPCPTILYGYGGFNISLTPYFSSVRYTWIKHFGNYVVANLRGGAEYGGKCEVLIDEMNFTKKNQCGLIVSIICLLLHIYIDDWHDAGKVSIY